MLFNIYYLNKKISLINKEQFNLLNINLEGVVVKDDKDINNSIYAWIKNNDQHVVLVFETEQDVFSCLVSEFFVKNELLFAAGGLIKNTDDKYLFIYKRGHWDLPKGKIDKGETTERAAIRECMEETSIQSVSLGKSIGTTLHLFNQKKKDILKITQWYLMSSLHNTELIPQAEEGIEQVAWFNKEEISNIVMQNTYASIIEVLHTANII